MTEFAKAIVRSKKFSRRVKRCIRLVKRLNREIERAIALKTELKR